MYPDMLLKFQNITKSFGPVEVLSDISFELETGKILGLVGENGAGKSTLMNILGGVHLPTRGNMVFKGEPFEPQSPSESHEAGIAFIHQELNTFPNLSIRENLFLSNFPKKKIGGLEFIDRETLDEQTRVLLNQVELDLSPHMQLEKITPAQQQLVEIAKALSSEPDLIIFDEPATSLSKNETQKLFELIERLNSENITMIYISHNLDDVLHLADEIAVLRDGQLVRKDQTSKYTYQSLVKDMVGRDFDQYFPERKASPAEEKVLKVNELSTGKILNEVSFVIRKNEILGFYGLVGSGRTALARIIYGLDPLEKGEVIWKGEKVRSLSPENWLKKGAAFLTENRREEGLMLQKGVDQNIQLAVLPKFCKNFLRWIKDKALRSKVEQVAGDIDIKFQNLTNQLVATLSGGNQQKVVLAKWLMTQPDLFIMDEPTRGIDIKAKQEVYQYINRLTAEGLSIVLISSEIEELMGLCDRILVMSRGKITGEFHRESFDRELILETALHRNTK